MASESIQVETNQSEWHDETSQETSDLTAMPDGFSGKACLRQNGHYQHTLRFFEKRRGYTPREFVRDYIHFHDSNVSNNTRRRRQILTAISHPASRRLLSAAADSKMRRPILTDTKSVGIEAGKTVSEELNGLTGHFPFSKWSSSIEQTFEAMDISKIVAEIAEKCPNWYSLLISILCHERSQWQSSYQKKDLPIHRLIYLITSMVMLQKASQKASFASTQMGLFLRSTGTKDRTIDVLSRFGICPIAATIRKKEEEIKRLARV